MAGSDEDLMTLAKIHTETETPANPEPVQTMQEVVEGDYASISDMKQMHRVEHAIHTHKEPPQVYDVSKEGTTLEAVPDIRIPHKVPSREQNPHEAITFGDVLETTVLEESAKAVTPSDAAAVLAIAKLLFGVHEAVKWGPAQRMRSVSERNLHEHRVTKTATGWAVDTARLIKSSEPTTLGEVLLGVRNELPHDWPITFEDAVYIREAEQHASPGRTMERGGFADHAIAFLPNPEHEIVQAEKKLAQPQ